MSAHIERSWVAKQGHYDTNTFILKSDGRLVASVITEDDARLIAAAPDLAWLLQQIADGTNNNLSTIGRVRHAARAALAKAGV